MHAIVTGAVTGIAGTQILCCLVSPMDDDDRRLLRDYAKTQERKRPRKRKARSSRKGSAAHAADPLHNNKNKKGRRRKRRSSRPPESSLPCLSPSFIARPFSSDDVEFGTVLGAEYGSGAEAVAAANRSYNRLIFQCSLPDFDGGELLAEQQEALTEFHHRQRILASLRDFFPPFVFEEMEESVSKVLGYNQYVAEKGGLYSAWDDYRGDIHVAFQSPLLVYVKFNLYRCPHYLLQRDLLVQFLDEAKQKGSKLVPADSVVNPGQKAVRICLPTQKHMSNEILYYVPEPTGGLLEAVSSIPLDDIAVTMEEEASGSHSSCFNTKRGNLQTSVGPSPQMSLDDSKLPGCCLPAMNDGEFFRTTRRRFVRLCCASHPKICPSNCPIRRDQIR